MNAEIKTKWIAALRSGEYKQGKMCLRNDGLYCCLGVLCDLHSKETGHKWSGFASLEYLGEDAALPREVMEWAGIGNGNPVLIYGPHGREVMGNTAAELNDSGKTFAEIAALIEENL